MTKRTQEKWEVYIRDEHSNEMRLESYTLEKLRKHDSSLALVYMETTASNEVCAQEISLSKGASADGFVRMVVPAESQTLFFQRHDSFELIYILRGELETYIEDGCYHFKEGDAFLLNRFTRNALVFKPDAEIVAVCMAKDYLLELNMRNELGSFNHKKISRFFDVNIAGEQENDFYDNRDYMEFRQIPGKDSYTPASEIIGALRDEIINRRPGFAYMARGLVVRLLMLMDDSRLFNTSYIDLGPSTEKDFVEDMKEYMAQNPRRIYRKEFSEMLHFNKTYLAEVFKKHTGKSVLEYNQEVYLKEAQRLLAETDMSIGEIIQQMGYTNRTPFYTLFNARFGVSPKEYRILTREADEVSENE